MMSKHSHQIETGYSHFLDGGFHWLERQDVGNSWSKDIKFQLNRTISGELCHSLVTVIDNNVSYLKVSGG